MVNRLVSVDNDLRLPLQVRNQLTADMTEQVEEYKDEILALIGQDTRAMGRLRAGLASSLTAPATVVFTGSSTTATHASTRSAWRYVNRVAAAMQASYPGGTCAEPPTRTLTETVGAPPTLPGIHAVNAGVSSTTSANYLTSTTIPQIGTLNPVAVIHMIGSNDYSTQMPIATYTANILAAMDGIDAVCATPPVHVLVHTYPRRDVVSPTIPWSDYGDALSEISKTRSDRVAFVNASRTFEAAGLPATDTFGFITADNVHANDAGLALLADTVVEPFDMRRAVPIHWIIRDTFARPSATSLGTATSGQTWTTSNGTWSVSGGVLTCNSAGTTLIDATTADVDVSVETKLAAGSNSFLIFRGDSDANRMSVGLMQTEGEIRLYKTLSSSGTVLETVPMILTANQWYQVRVLAIGSVVYCYINGTRVFGHSMAGGDYTTFSPYTKVGVRNTGTVGVQWDNFSVRTAV